MLSRPATKISLTAEDVAAYEQRKTARDAAKMQRMADTAGLRNMIDTSISEVDPSPAAQTKVAKSKLSQAQRVGLGGSRA